MDNQCRYSVYGISLQSSVPLALPVDASAVPAQIAIEAAPQTFFTRACWRARFEADLPDWYRYARLPDGSSYLRWNGLGEFLVSAAGGSIKCRRFTGASPESFQVYLLQRAISFALVKQGFEPLHATAVVMVTGGYAIAFLGDGGVGKSSLAACFLQAGDKLLTDDLLLLKRGVDGFWAYPGPARIKLFPHMARRLFGEAASGVPMNPDTKKLVMPLAAGQVWTEPVPVKIRALYVLASSRAARARGIRLEPLAPRAALLEIVRHTFNYLHIDPDRLERQFVEAARIAVEVPVRRLVHPRVLGALSEVRDVLLADACQA